MLCRYKILLFCPTNKSFLTEEIVSKNVGLKFHFKFNKYASPISYLLKQ